MIKSCPFCSDVNKVSLGELPSNELAYVRHDKFPVSDGHLLIIPKRHASDWFALTNDEKDAIMSLVDAAKHWLERHYKPAGYNIGMNCGDAAGQTIAHMHCHLIPRYAGDREDPRGGVRWVIPEKADYWSAI